MKKFNLALSMTFCIAMDVLFSLPATAAGSVPAFDGGGNNCIVIDSEDVKGKKFDLSIKFLDYADDGQIDVEVFGYGGKFPEEWAPLGKVTMYGFGETIQLPFLKGVKMDYIHYRYFAINVINPTNKKFLMVHTTQSRNLMVALAEADADPELDPLPILHGHPNAYEFDALDFIGKIDGSVSFKNYTKKALNFTLLAYDLIRHKWFTFGSVKLDKYGTYRIMTPDGKGKVSDYRYFALEEESNAKVFCNISSYLNCMQITVLDR